MLKIVVLAFVGSSAKPALKRGLGCVLVHVACQLTQRAKRSPTHGARDLRVGLMRFHVGSQVVRIGEGEAALGALEEPHRRFAAGRRFDELSQSAGGDRALAFRLASMMKIFVTLKLSFSWVEFAAAVTRTWNGERMHRRDMSLVNIDGIREN